MKKCLQGKETGEDDPEYRTVFLGVGQRILFKRSFSLSLFANHKSFQTHKKPKNGHHLNILPDCPTRNKKFAQFRGHHHKKSLKIPRRI